MDRELMVDQKPLRDAYDRKLERDRLTAEFRSMKFQGNPPVDSGPLFTGQMRSAAGEVDMFENPIRKKGRR